ncbi:glycerate kinase [Pokkaliibacter sp. CJK22405]|uniref:glycerate kinase n=1 Tax=Pokkaliibacter sp. CJK22405 TaxID=3384615 RepID=UPI00398535BA
MRVVIAPDSFKECLTAMEAATAIAEGIREIFPEAECRCLPMADGGEGTTETLVSTRQGERIYEMVKGPMGEPVKAMFGLIDHGQTAVIEMAEASGLHLVPANLRDPQISSTYGTGQLIKAALERGARHIIMGLGGSATNDGGSGMLLALGATMKDAKGNDLSAGGLALSSLAELDLSGLDIRLNDTTIEVACDVNNPLCGEQGASAIFGPQKGATPEMVQTLDKALQNFGKMLAEQTGRDALMTPGVGAAGGLGAALFAALGASLTPGVDLVMKTINLRDAMVDADLVVTGEGRVDSQTIFGKTPYGVAQAAKERNLPVVAVAGSVGQGFESVYEHGIDIVLPIGRGPQTLNEALVEAKANLTRTGRSIASFWQLSRQ